MSAAAVAFSETPSFVDAPVSVASAEDRLRDLVHELRQPLSCIEAIAYYVEMTLPVEQGEARDYMLKLQRLVADTNTLLERSVNVPRKSAARTTIAL